MTNYSLFAKTVKVIIVHFVARTCILFLCLPDANVIDTIALTTKIHEAIMSTEALQSIDKQYQNGQLQNIGIQNGPRELYP